MGPQYHLSLDAHRECTTFEEFMGSLKWLEEVHTFRGNPLRSAVMDEEMVHNRGSTKTILPKLFSAFIRHRPQIWSMTIALHDATVAEATTVPPQSDNQKVCTQNTSNDETDFNIVCSTGQSQT